MAKVPRCIERLSRIYRLNRKFLDGPRSYQDNIQNARWHEIALVHPREREREGGITSQTEQKERKSTYA